MLRSLGPRMEPRALPRIGVFMNRVKGVANKPTNGAFSFAQEVEQVCSETAREQEIDVRVFKSHIAERLGIKEATIGGGVPADLSDFQNLWKEIEAFLNEVRILPNAPGSGKVRRLVDELRSAGYHGEK